MKNFRDFLTESLDEAAEYHPYTLKKYNMGKSAEKGATKGKDFHIMTNHEGRKVGTIVAGHKEGTWRLEGHRNNNEYPSVEAAAHSLHQKNLKMFKKN